VRCLVIIGDPPEDLEFKGAMRGHAN